MQAYSQDLRERLLAACLLPTAWLQSVATHFQVSVSFLGKLLHRHPTSGSVAALPRRGGASPRLDAGGHETLRACLVGQPDATLDELRQQLAAVGGPVLWRTACWKAVRALGWDRKKSLHAAERDTDLVRELRAAFLEVLAQEDFTRFKFVNETTSNLTYTRRYGRAPNGRRLDQGVPLHSGPNVTLIAALTPAGLEAVMTVSEAVNGAVFAAYLHQVLSPTLVAGDVVVLDNLSAHKVAGLAALVEARGARLLYLPPYSPDFNPIELAFSKLKTWLRTAQARTRDALEETLRKAAEWITQQDAENWFDHCGYHIH